MELSIDRFEGDYAVCISDSGASLDIPVSLLPPGAAEGSIITPDGAGGYVLLSENERHRRAENHTLAEKLFE